jgi:hypothetical protein
MKNDAEDVLEDLDPIGDQEPDRTLEEAVWNGKKTRIRLEHPACRDQVLVGPQSNCIDCAKLGKTDSGHQFHAAASKVNGQWVGPEGDHIALLQAGGWIAGTQEARDRAGRQAEIDMLRGTNGTKDRPQGFPEYKAITLERVQAQWRNETKNGPVGMMVIELDQRREETALLREAVKKGLGEGFEPLVAALKEALSGREDKRK